MEKRPHSRFSEQIVRGLECTIFAAKQTDHITAHGYMVFTMGEGGWFFHGGIEMIHFPGFEILHTWVINGI